MSTGEFTGFHSAERSKFSNLSEAAAHHICVMMAFHMGRMVYLPMVELGGFFMVNVRYKYTSPMENLWVLRYIGISWVRSALPFAHFDRTRINKSFFVSV